MPRVRQSTQLTGEVVMLVGKVKVIIYNLVALENPVPVHSEDLKYYNPTLGKVYQKCMLLDNLFGSARS